MKYKICQSGRADEYFILLLEDGKLCWWTKETGHNESFDLNEAKSLLKRTDLYWMLDKPESLP